MPFAPTFKMKKTVFLVVTVVLFLVVLFLRSIQLNRLKGGSTLVTATPAPVKEQKASIKLQSGSRSLVSGEEGNIIVVADSVKKPIVGFDVVINYPEDKVILLSLGRQLADFSYFKKQLKNRIIITGVKKPEVKNNIVFDNTVLTEIKFKTKAEGMIDFKIDWQAGTRNKTNLIDDNSVNILGRAEDIRVGSGEKITLDLGKPVSLAKGLSAELISVEKPDVRCRDCMTVITVRVMKDGKKQESFFKEGGIMGLKQDNFSSFGYNFVLSEVSSNRTVTLVYYESK